MNLGSYGPRVRPRGPEARERGAAAPAARCATTAARFARPASRILSLMSIASCSGKKEVADMVDNFSAGVRHLRYRSRTRQSAPCLRVVVLSMDDHALSHTGLEALAAADLLHLARLRAAVHGLDGRYGLETLEGPCANEVLLS